MSVMTPLPRLCQVLRAIGAGDEQADEFAKAMITIVGLGVAVMALLIVLVE